MKCRIAIIWWCTCIVSVSLLCIVIYSVCVLHVPGGQLLGLLKSQLLWLSLLVTAALGSLFIWLITIANRFFEKRHR
jgi:hypothetical protein